MLESSEYLSQVKACWSQVIAWQLIAWSSMSCTWIIYLPKNFLNILKSVLLSTTIKRLHPTNITETPLDKCCPISIRFIIVCKGYQCKYEICLSCIWFTILSRRVYNKLLGVNCFSSLFEDARHKITILKNQLVKIFTRFFTSINSVKNSFSHDFHLPSKLFVIG